MRRLLLLAIFGLFCYTSSISAIAEDGWTGSVDVRSQYIGGMNGANIVNEPVIQPAATLNRGDCYINIWASFHLADPLSLRKGDELDLSGGCAWKWGSIKHTIAFLYYDFYPQLNLRGDLFVLRDTMTFPQIAGWTPALAIETVILQDKQVFPGTFRYKAEISRDVSIGGNRFVSSLAIGGHDGTPDLKPEAIGFIRGGISYPVRAGSITIAPSLTLQWGGRKGGIANDEILLGVSIFY